LKFKNHSGEKTVKKILSIFLLEIEKVKILSQFKHCLLGREQFFENYF